MDCQQLAGLAPAPEPLALAASVFSARGKLAVTLIAMSADAATATCADQPPCDSFAFLVRNGVKVPAIVAWTGDDRFGLRFEAPLADEQRRSAFLARNRQPRRTPDRIAPRIVLPAALPEPADITRAATIPEI